MAELSSPFARWANKPHGDGDGLHSDLYTAACFMVEEGHTDEVIFNFLREAANQVEERHVPDREITSAINYGRAKVQGDKVSEKWPAINDTFRYEVFRNYPANMDKLSKAEEELPQNSAYYLERLYLPNELVCAAASTYSFDTQSREDIMRVCSTHYLEYVNPNPMSSKVGVTLEGKESTHCEGNTGPRVYLVIEFDVGTPQEQVSAVKYLSKKLPLVMMLFSGGKSIHAWFYVEGLSEHYVRAFFEEARMLGADTVTWSRCQFCRMPAGRNNKTQNLQSVLYFKPPTRKQTT